MGQKPGGKYGLGAKWETSCQANIGLQNIGTPGEWKYPSGMHGTRGPWSQFQFRAWDSGLGTLWNVRVPKVIAEPFCFSEPSNDNIHPIKFPETS
mmetsp:Transcript_38080/g.79789  ORF Transcript_38080/g.79789 Transcript_38080/m.79789 type:complete len:95 (+) Transcript_38080:273-557(+)